MEEGRYVATCVNIDFATTEKGNNYARLVMRIAPGEQFEGEDVFYYMYFTEKTSQRSVDTLRTLGWTGDNIADVTHHDIQTAVEIDVQRNEYEGKLSFRVGWINAIGEYGPLPKKMNDEQRTQFGREMMRYTRAAGKPAPKQRQAPVQQSQATAQAHEEISDDDIPF